MNNEFIDAMKHLQLLKSEDYNNGKQFITVEDASKMANITVEQGFMFMINLKVLRLNTLINKDNANFESLNDSLIDLANYSNGLYDYKKKENM